MSPPLRADIAFPASGLRLSIRDDEAVMCTMTAPFAAAGKGMALMTPDEVKRVRRHVVDGHAGWREEETLRRRWHRTLEAGALVVTAAAVARVLAHGLLLAQAATLIAAATTGFLVIRYVLLRGLPAPIEIVRPLPRWLGSILWALGVRARSAATPRGSRRAP
jgi:hypothetical protein